MDSDKRIISFPDNVSKTTNHFESEKKIKLKKTPKNRVITQEKRWVLQSEDYKPSRQWNCLFVSIEEKLEDWMRTLAKQQIMAKICGYRAQDIKNKLLNIDEFVNLDYVMVLLQKSCMKCFYCKEMVQVLYEHVREPKQWTLDRIENNQGHNKSNVIISCLQCNLNRRCIYHERYVFTKQMKIIRIDNNIDSNTPIN